MPGFRRTRPGNQVIADVDGSLRLYIGQHFEVRVLNGAEITDPPRLDGPRFDPCPEGTYCIFLGGIFNQNEDPTPPQGPELSWRSYYFAGGKRIAMREVNALADPFGTVTWLLGDHLGSTSLSVSESGGVLAEAKYTPLSPKGMLREGEQRTLAGDLPTDYGYTGQREESALGLMYYVARWYDSGIGHFVQADTVVPGAGNPAAWNRYAYVMYNPIVFTDPNGHNPECGPDGMFCSNNFEERYGISFSGEWNDRNKAIIRTAVQVIGSRFGAIMGMSSQMAFYAIFGGLNFDWVAAGGVSNGYGWAFDDHIIKFDGMYNNFYQDVHLVVHEIGHIFDRAVCAANNGGVCENIFGEGTARLGVSNYPTGTCFEENCLGRISYDGPEEGQFWGFAGGVGFWQFGQVWADGVVNGKPIRVLDTAEIWADMFVGWTYNKWETDQVGQITERGATRQNYMNNSMSQYIQLIIGGK